MKKFYLELLKETIELKNYLNEFRSNFQWKDFNNLKDQKEKIAYAEQQLKSAGEGSSRIAFFMPNLKSVLKIAKNNKGIAQNREEVNIYTNPAIKPIVTKILNAANDYSWIVSEIARPIPNEQAFEKEVGFPINYIDLVLTIEPNDPRVEKYTTKYPLIKHVFDLVQTGKMMYGDLVRPEHYGKTIDGRIVLLDYGFTHEVWRKHYKKQTGAMIDPKRETTEWYTTKPESQPDDQEERFGSTLPLPPQDQVDRNAATPKPARKRNI